MGWSRTHLEPKTDDEAARSQTSADVQMDEADVGSPVLLLDGVFYIECPVGCGGILQLTGSL